MNQRKLNALVEYLMRKNKAVTAKELASFLNMSVRSIKSYVVAINKDQFGSIIRSGKDGYEIDGNKAQLYLRLYRMGNEDVPQTYEERAKYINRKFLVYRVDCLDYYLLADELNFSVETIKKDFIKMNKSYVNFGISYEIHSDYARLVADERSIRKLARYVFFSDSVESVMGYAEIRESFPEIDIDLLRDILNQTLLDYNLYVNDFSMINIVLHLTLMIERIKAKRYLTFDNSFVPDKSSREYMITEKLCEALEKAFSVRFIEEEITGLFLLLKANANIIIGESNEELFSFVGKEIFHFTRELTYALSNKYYLNMNHDSFFMPFAVHLKNLMFRLKTKQKNHNSVCDLIRYSHPAIFDMAVFCATLIEERYQIRLEENEISYLALHIGGEIERQYTDHEKVRTVFLCPQYLELSNKMYNQLLFQFGNEIELIACISDPEQLDKYRFELLITTVDILPLKIKCRVIKVPILGISRSRMEITEAIEEIMKRRKFSVLKNNLSHFFAPEFFFVIEDPSISAKNLLAIMAAEMLALGVVQEDFYDCLLEREIASSTAFPNIAIPHSMKMDAIKTSIGVMLCPNGVTWGGNKVYLVLCMAINKLDASMFMQIYQALIELFDNEKELKKFTGMKSFDDFIIQLEESI